MRNLDIIRLMPVEELAKYLVHKEYINDYDYDYDDNIIDNYKEYYSSPRDCFDTYEEAKEDCIKWLNEDWR